ncbi:MAG: low affinity iron permease family protein [Burkholderiales bacterium]
MNLFNLFAQRSALVMGSAPVFLASVLSVALWAFSGPYFHYSESWQLVVNTGTNIITFWMVFVIQNTQNRDARIIHLKLDELILSMKNARNLMINLDELNDDQLEHLEEQFKKLNSAINKKHDGSGVKKTVPENKKNGNGE